MKKFTAWILAAMMCLTLAACGQQEAVQPSAPEQITPDETVASQSPEEAAPTFSFKGTTFTYLDTSFDVTSIAGEITEILSVSPAGGFLVIEGDTADETSAYVLFDTADSHFGQTIRGNNLIWHDDDLSTAVYYEGSGVYSFDGMLIREIELAEGESIYDIDFSDDHNSLAVTIVNSTGGQRVETFYL